MFGMFNGLPVHVLVLHLAVIAAPLAAVSGLAVWVPRWRKFARWPFLVLSAVAVVAVYLTKESGEVLQRSIAAQLEGNITGEIVDRHAALGGRLFIASLVLFAVSLAVAVVVGRTGNAVIGIVSAFVVTVVAVGVVVLTVQTGEAGAEAVWNPSGSVDYSGN
ncbi:hypothetical protein SAMN05421642_11485 [Rhodococcoides kyotonense]|uniref:DUF2231 domain-containing protein n=1 Tax=Rhodococcoides kyotonense TaxID=398843 RepID=A0A239LV23_9NOCA|nr:hypothetical protein SAMN05421642_11485 [Rhodococcus kyotonensis]